MKKFLSLVLALVMTMSLVTISAGAKDFTDSADVNYAAAIDVMSELKVIDGYTDGSFRPAVELNRGAAAKIICNMILGPTTAAALSASSAPFVDVPADSVFAGYITYCAKEGIISGYADGTFRPTAPLTGYAFAKMLLGALGYDADIEGYTGANWSVNVAKQAYGIGLEDGIDGFVGTAYVNRETACQMALNTLKATMVRYASKTTVTVNGAQVVVGGSDAYEEDQYGYEDSMDAEFLQFAEKYFPNLKVQSTEDDFGRPAKEWKIKNKSVGVFAETPDAVYTASVAGKTIYADLGAKVEKGDFVVYVDGELDGEEFKNFAGDTDVVPAAFEMVKKNSKEIGAQGRLTEVYYDADAETATVVMVNTYVMEVAEDYDEDDESLTLTEVDVSENAMAAEIKDIPELESSKLSSDDFAGLDAYVEGDLVMVTIADDTIKSIAALEGFNAVIDEHVYAESVTADGTEYKFAWFWADCADGDNLDENYGVDDEFVLYTDAYGNVIFSEPVSAEKVYAFVTEFAETSFMNKNSKVDAYMYFVDGSEDEVRVAKVEGQKVKAVDIETANAKVGYALEEEQNSWFTFVEKDGSYELKLASTEVTNADMDGVAEAISGVIVDPEETVMITVNAQEKVRGNKNTQFIIVDGDGDVHTYTGIKNAPKVTADSETMVVAIVDDNNYAEYVFISLGNGTMDGVANSSDAAFIVAFEKEGTDAADNDYYRYKGLLNGEMGKIRTETDIVEAGSDLAAGLYVEVEYDTDSGYVSDWEAIDGDADPEGYEYLAIAETDKLIQKGNVIAVEGATQTYKFYMADDAVIYVVDLSDKDADIVSAKQLCKTFAEIAGDLYAVMNDDGDVTALYVSKA